MSGDQQIQQLKREQFPMEDTDPSKVIEDYIEWLNRGKERTYTMLIPTMMKACIEHAILMNDIKYIWYLIRSLLCDYDKYQDLLINDLLHQSYGSSICFFLPLEYIPTDYIRDEKFFQCWLKAMQYIMSSDGGIIVNYRQCYQYRFKFNQNCGIDTIYSFLNGINTGYVFKYYDNGQKMYECYVLNGKIHGTFIKWRETGVKEEEKVIFNEVLHGTLRKWYESGNLKEEQEYFNGKRNGMITSWYENGEKESEWNYVDGLRQGEAKHWYESGCLKRVDFYINDKQNGMARTFYDDKDTKRKMFEMPFIDGVISGTATGWYFSGKKKFVYLYDRNRRVGPYIEWRDYAEYGRQAIVG